MKRIILSVALIIGLGIAKISAQTVTGGIKVEANTSNFILSDLDNVESKLGIGVTVGGIGIVEFSDNLAFRSEVLLHLKNSTIENKGGGEMDFQYFGVEIPLYAVGQFGMGNGKAFVGVGPYVGVGIDARYKSSGDKDIVLYDNSVFQRWDVGAGLLLGYELSNKLQINAGYKIGFIDALDTGKDNATMLNQTISVGLAFSF